jgi:hypothetical protein
VPSYQRFCKEILGALVFDFSEELTLRVLRQLTAFGVDSAQTRKVIAGLDWDNVEIVRSIVVYNARTGLDCSSEDLAVFADLQ